MEYVTWCYLFPSQSQDALSSHLCSGLSRVQAFLFLDANNTITLSPWQQHLGTSVLNHNFVLPMLTHMHIFSHTFTFLPPSSSSGSSSENHFFLNGVTHTQWHFLYKIYTQQWKKWCRKIQTAIVICSVHSCSINERHLKTSKVLTKNLELYR